MSSARIHRNFRPGGARAALCLLRAFAGLAIGVLAPVAVAALAPAAPAAAGEVIDSIVCTVNGKAVRRREVIEMIGRKDFTKSDWDQACRELIIQRLTREIAEREHIEVTDEEVDKRLDERLTENNLTRDDIKEELQTYRDQMRRYLLKTRVIGKAIQHKLVIMPGDVREYYDTRQDEFRVEERRRISMISVLFDKAAEPEAARKAAREKIEQALQHLKDKKEFATVAKELSNDPYAEKGGDWGWKKKGDLVDALNAAAFSIDVGQISDIVETANGFHLLKIEERQSEFLKPLKDVEDAIRETLYKARYNEKSTEYVDGLLQAAVIERYDSGPAE